MDNKLYNLTALREIVDNNENELKEMVQMFVDLSPSIHKDMKESLEENNFEKLSNLAHKLKSNFRLLEITELEDIARSIEMNSKKTADKQSLEELMNKINIILPEVINQIKKNELS